MSYYKDQIPAMIDKYKAAMKQCLDIIDQEIDGELSDDKLHSALKGKRMAAEDAKWYAKEVDVLEGELRPETKKEDEEVSTKAFRKV